MSRLTHMRISKFSLSLFFICLCTLSGCASSGGSSSASLSLPDVPQVAAWESHMLEFGQKYCDANQIAQLGTWEGSVWYYDGIRVYYQIADYTGDSNWNRCANYVRSVYRNYVVANDGLIPGWRVFPIGLEEDYYRTGDPDSKRAVLLLANKSAFAHSAGGESFELSRETAYLIHAYLSAENLGENHEGQLSTSVNFALSHLDQWTGSKSASYVKPFMLGLTFEALIRYFEISGDARIPPAVASAADWLWENTWDENLKAFPYIVCRPGADNAECREDHSKEGVDLNLLIAPAYAWLYLQTGDAKYLSEGDKLFDAGVSAAYLGTGKHFSQNYRWSFDFVKWRRG